MAVIDTLKLARVPRDKGGFTQEAAEATAEALDSAFGEAAAAKRGVVDVATSLRAEIAALAHRVDRLASDLRKEMADMRTELLRWVIGIVGFQTTAILGGVAALVHLLK